MNRKVPALKVYALFIFFFIFVMFLLAKKSFAFSLNFKNPDLAKNNFLSSEEVNIDLNKYASKDIKVIVTGKDNKEITVEKQKTKEGIKLKQLNSFIPGKFKVELTYQDETVLIDEFTWGVLAINTNKSVYTPNEKAKLSFAVLDEEGNMVCDADLKLLIKNDELNINEELSIANGRIKVNPECWQKKFTLNPDYSAEFQIGATGNYIMDLVATTKNGSYSVTDVFEVHETVPLDVERISATRIYPPHSYPVNIFIKANQEFNGRIEETVPLEFQISPSNIGATYSKLVSGQNEQIIAWDVNLNIGDTLNISYQYKAPNISPQFYLLGPLKFIELQKKIDSIPNGNVSSDVEIISPDSFDVVKNDDGEIIKIIPKIPDKLIMKQDKSNSVIETEEIEIFKEARFWQIAADLMSGPNNPSIAGNNGNVGTIAWTNPGNVFSNDAVQASVSLKTSQVSQYLLATGLGFTIPSGSKILGIVVEVNKYASNATYIRDNSVKLFKNGSPIGDDKANTAAWPTSDPVTYVTYGLGTTDLWGTTWTAEEINSGTFSLGFSVKDTRTNSTVYTAYIDHIRVTVYYDPPLILTQNSYRWYVNEDSESVSDPWPAGPLDLNTSTPIGSEDNPLSWDSVLRLRISINNSSPIIPADTLAFKLKYAAMVGAACGGGDETWFDLGTPGSTAAAWRGYNNPGVANGMVLSTAYLSVDNIPQSYVETNLAPKNPKAINNNSSAEWGWVVQNYSATFNTQYCFKLTNSDDSDLAGGYSYYPQLITTTPEVIALTGTVYSDEGQNNLGSNKTVKVLVDGRYIDSTETSSAGQWNMNVPAVAGSIITVYLFGETEKMALVYKSNGVEKSELNLYQNNLIIRSDSGTISNSELSAGKNNDSDILFTENDNIINLISGINMYIWSGTAFSPESSVYTQGNGNFHLAQNSVFNNTKYYNYYISGNLILDSGSTFSGTNNVIVNGGSVTGDGYIDNYGTFNLVGTGNFGGTTNWQFYDLVFGDNSTATTSKTNTNQITINNQLKVNTNHTLLAGTGTWSFNNYNNDLLHNISQLVTGSDHTCVLKSDNSAVYCWGYNGSGQLGDKTNTNRLSPVQVVGLGGTGVLSDISQLSAGGSHTCALKSDNSAVYCWGGNLKGQLGNNTATSYKYPVQVVGLGGTGVLSDISQLSAGGLHTCAFKSDNSAVFCWGYNNYGQLGDNTSGTNRLFPVQVVGLGGTGVLSDISQVTTGSSHTCALKSDNSAVFCWGYNSYGQLGDNTYGTNRLFPVQVVGLGGTGVLSDISQVTTRSSHTCALKSDNSAVFCWGYNLRGQLGDNTSGTNRLFPVQVVGLGGTGVLSGISQVSTGDSHTCALKSDNSAVFCWGYNSSGQIGDNTSGTNRLFPVQVVGLSRAGVLSGISQVSVGFSHTCALKSDNSAVYCWGDNSYGQQGNNASGTNHIFPVQSIGLGDTDVLSDISQVSTGDSHTCALKSDNSAVFCWGYNSSGQIGDNTSGTNRLSPVQVVGLGGTGVLSDISQLSSGSDHTCALKSDNSAVYCWGDNFGGQLGDKTSGTDRLFPVQVVGLGGTGVLSDISQLRAGGLHTCALKSDNSAVYCWGYNSYGQLGNNTTTSSYRYPVQVVGLGGTGVLSDISQLSAGSNHTCALKSDNSAVFCWGYNNYGQLGNNTTTYYRYPVQVVGLGGTGVLSGISQITIRYSHTCALKSDNSAVFCWGYNLKGQLGDNTSGTNRLFPVQVVGLGGTGVLSDISQLSAGGSHTCALKSDDSAVFCWGDNIIGQLGNNTATSNYKYPVQVVGLGGTGVLSDISQLSAGFYHTCALKSDNSAVYCWGDNNYSQLGKGTPGDDQNYPSQVIIFLHKYFNLLGTFDPQTSLFRLDIDFSSKYSIINTLIAPTTYYDLTLNSVNGSYLLTAPININNNFNLNTGVFDSNNQSLNISGNFTNSASFVPNKGIVNFSSNKTSILDYTGDTSFYDLTISGIGKTVQFDPTYQTIVTNSLDFQGDSCTNKLSLNSILDNNQWDINFTGVGSSAVVNYVDLHDSNAINPLTADNSTQFNNNNTNWTINQGSCFANQPPNLPTNLTQTKITDIPINIGQWSNSNSIKFSALATDSNLDDSLQLCIEIKPIGTGFANTEDSCGSLTSNIAGGVTLTHTISNLTDSEQYHWQTRVKDSSDDYSDWVAFGNNLEYERDFGIDTSSPTGGLVFDGLESGVDKDFNDGSLSVLSANWNGVDSTISGLDHYEYSIGTSAYATDIKDWTPVGINTSATVTGLTLNTSNIYFFNIKAIDNAGNLQTPISSDGQFIAPSLSFNVSPDTFNFSSLNQSNNFSVGDTSILVTSTNAYGGYSIRAYASDYLTSQDTGATIPQFNGGTYSTPDAWLDTDFGFGYHSSKLDNTPCLGGNSPPCFAPFSLSYPGDVVAEHNGNISGTPITDEKLTIDYKVKTHSGQLSSFYTTNLIYLITAKY